MLPNPRDAHRRLSPIYSGSSQYAPLTWILIGLSVLATVWSKMGEDREILLRFFISQTPYHSGSAAGFLPEVFQQGQIYRLITPIFFTRG